MGMLRQNNSWVVSAVMAGNILLPFVSILCIIYLLFMDRTYRFTKGSWGWVVVYLFFPLVGMLMAGRKAFADN